MITKMQLRMHNVHSRLAAMCGKIEIKCQLRMQTSLIKLYFVLK